MSLITDHKKDIIRIVWEEISPKGSTSKHTFDFTLPKKVDRDLASNLAKEQLSRFRTESSYAFLQMDKYYNNLNYDALYDLARKRDEQFESHLMRHTEFTFGHISPEFTEFEKDLIQSCKLLGYDIGLITEKTDEEIEQRKSATQYMHFHNRVKKEIKSHSEAMDRLWKDLPNAPEKYEDALNILYENEEWQDHNRAIIEIENRNPEILKSQQYFNKILAEGLRYYDKRAVILYKEWCKNVPLQDFTDEYDDEWINYLLEKLDTPQGHNPLSSSCISRDKLKEQLNMRNRNRTTLANFSAPDHIDKRDIYNNCWYDKQHDMWYVQDDNLDEILQGHADSDLDDSQSTIGRRVWGFKGDNVQMFCGWPSITYESEDGRYEDRVTFSRVTGQELRRTEFKFVSFILPILRDEDINKHMECMYGGLAYSSTEVACCILPSGGFKWMTPKMLKLAGENYGFGDIPLNERVRRALFKVESGVCFNVQAPLEPVPIKIPDEYPDHPYMNRFARTAPFVVCWPKKRMPDRSHV